MDSVQQQQLIDQFPLLDEIIKTNEVLWINDKRGQQLSQAFTAAQMIEAQERLARFAPYLQLVFPELARTAGIIESPLKAIPNMQRYIAGFNGQLYIKCDHELPISGSIKARGGIYEVLKVAETIALNEGLLSKGTDYAVLAQQACRDVFQQYKIAVGSTGNLGLSIGIIGATLGFQVTVHMSADAKRWKKDLLREKGVEVIEYEADYSIAVAQGRQQATSDPYCHFIDDENSMDLFAGYSVAAIRLQQQLQQQNIEVTSENPLHVYLPCGVGGGPGGVAFGLHALFGDNVYLYFAEPTHAPCMTIGMMTGLHDKISVQDLGIDGVTEADGLAVGRASGFVGQIMEPILAGCYTVEDHFLFESMHRLMATENMFLEPSAHAAMKGAYLMKAQQGTHIVWATGGSMVPDAQRQIYFQQPF